MNRAKKQSWPAVVSWGMQDLVRKLPGVLRTVWATAAAMCPTPPTATTAPTPRRWRWSSTPRRRAFATCWSSSSRSTIRAPGAPGQ